MATGRQLGWAAVIATGASFGLLILVLVAGLAISRDRGACDAGPASLAGPIGVVLYVAAIVAFVIGLGLYLLARKAGETVSPAEGFLVLSGIGFFVVYLALLVVNGCPGGGE